MRFQALETLENTLFFPLSKKYGMEEFSKSIVRIQAGTSLALHLYQIIYFAPSMNTLSTNLKLSKTVPIRSREQ